MMRELDSFGRVLGAVMLLTVLQQLLIRLPWVRDGEAGNTSLMIEAEELEGTHCVSLLVMERWRRARRQGA